MENKNNKIPTILNYNNLNFENFEYFFPQKIKQDKLFSLISYNLSKTKIVPLYLETPILKVLSPILEIDNEYFIDVELSIKGQDTSFYDFISKLDEKNIMTSYHNSSNWFSQNIPLETIQQYYNSSIQLSDINITYLRLKIPTYNNKLLLEIYNRNKKLIQHSHIKKDDNMIGIIRFMGLKFESKHFIPEWEIYKIKLLKIEEKEILPHGYIFSDNQESEEVKEEVEEKVVKEEVEKEVEKEVEEKVVKEEVEKEVEKKVVKEEVEKEVEKKVVKEEVKEDVKEEVEKKVVKEEVKEDVKEEVVNKVVKKRKEIKIVEEDSEEDDYIFSDAEYELDDNLEVNDFDYEKEKENTKEKEGEKQKKTELLNKLLEDKKKQEEEIEKLKSELKK